MDELDEIFVNYPTLQDAMRQALIEALQADPNREHGGMLWRTPEGKYRLARGERLVSGGPTGLTITSKKPLKGDEPAAMFHTHPGRDALADAFSGIDRDAVIDMEGEYAGPATSFMVTSERGQKVRELTPESAAKQRGGGALDPVAGRLRPEFSEKGRYPLTRTTEDEIIRLLRGRYFAGMGRGPSGGGGF